MLPPRNTKILATLGPATSSAETIDALVKAGADCFRLNFSHGDHEGHKNVHRIIRQSEAKFHQPIGILADMQGPKLRVDTFKDGAIELAEGAEFSLHLNAVEGNESQVGLYHPEIFSSVNEGDQLLLDDGKVRLKVTANDGEVIKTTVVAGKTLSDRKGVNLPDTVLSMSPLTPKDRKDLEYALSLGVNWIGLSFVQRPQDLEEARKLIGDRAQIMVKIEKPSAVRHLDEMIALSDAVMVARGDLGVEMPPENVPAWQKEIIQACRLAGKPVVVATQMLESMISSPTPTRAEASDVATAVFDGADCVMLSAESAVGDYAPEAVSMMDRIIRQTEQGRFYRSALVALEHNLEETGSDAISKAAAQVAETVRAKAIVTHTRTGRTALRAARERPSVPILCITQSQDAARWLRLVWGVHSVHTDHIADIEVAAKEACDVSVSEGLSGPDDLLVMTAGVPFGRVGTTNTLRILKVPSS